MRQIHQGRFVSRNPWCDVHDMGVRMHPVRVCERERKSVSIRGDRAMKERKDERGRRVSLRMAVVVLTALTWVFGASGVQAAAPTLAWE